MDDVRQRFQSRLTVRSLIIAMIGSALVVAGHWSQRLLMSALPYLLFVVGAAWLPQGPPTTFVSAAVASSMSLLQAGIYASLALERWRQGGVVNEETATLGCHGASPNVHLVRAIISFVWAAAFLLLAGDSLRRHCEGFWMALRLVVGVCSGVRLVMNVLLQALGAPPNCFVPGNITFISAVLFNFACVILAAFVLSTRCRHRLSEWTGGACVVLTLAEVQKSEEAPRGILDDDTRSHSTDAHSTDAHSQEFTMGSKEEEPHRAALRARSHAGSRGGSKTGTHSVISAGSSAAPELGHLWGEVPAAPAGERLGTAVFEDGSDDGELDRRSPPRDFVDTAPPEG